jgi:DNA-binding NtrC family response regulator
VTTFVKAGFPSNDGALPLKEDEAAVSTRLLVVDGGGLSPRFCEMLRSFGYDVAVVPRGGDVLDHLQQAGAVGGILLDIHQLASGGMVILAELHKRFPQFPVLTMGSVAQLKLLRRSIELGAAEYLVTPTAQELLKRKCAFVFLERSRVAPLQGSRSREHRTGPIGRS